jgi:hypothetical protein
MRIACGIYLPVIPATARQVLKARQELRDTS